MSAKLVFPSPEFDDLVAAVCHGVATEEGMVSLRELLRADAAARDEYLWRVSLHARLASDPELFAPAAAAAGAALEEAPVEAGWDEEAACAVPSAGAGRSRVAWPFRGTGWAVRVALAAGLVVLLGAVGWFGFEAGRHRRGETTRAVAMLNQVVNARWAPGGPVPRLGAPLEPGILRMESGQAQIVFHNGARVALEGPAELRLVSSSEAECLRGVLAAEVPPQARGFRVVSPRLEVTDLGTAFGMKVEAGRSEVHVFEGRVVFRAAGGGVGAGAGSGAGQEARAGRGAVVEGRGPGEGPDAVRWVDADRGPFQGLFDLQARSVAAGALLHDRWRTSVRALREDPSLWVHFDFEHGGVPAWRLANAGSRRDAIPDAAIVGCEWREGRWSGKPAVEFRGISDRLRLSVPGDLESVTFAAWVRVHGLDRPIQSLFMSDGFAPGTLHWVLRDDGVLGLTVIGRERGHQILAGPPVIGPGQFGVWIHLAVVLDGRAREVVHYVNGQAVSRHRVRLGPPYRVGAAELGNWNPLGFPGNDPFLVRSLAGAMDEFCLFARALGDAEIAALHADGRPQADAVAAGPAVESFLRQPNPTP